MADIDAKRHVVTIEINGVRKTISVEARKLLVHLIRDDLGLTGTHIGCDTSQRAPSISMARP
jgi:aerobic carbon-monoxide dehydrogenase small subunit